MNHHRQGMHLSSLCPILVRLSLQCPGCFGGKLVSGDPGVRIMQVHREFEALWRSDRWKWCPTQTPCVCIS
ncbi:hypothetical protein M758_5G049900 [Ceratodon purpureus]|nr:hypothetical protein M758_5G049900 [Ceratodon purpureus]